MCGLFGFARNIDEQYIDKEFMKDSLYALLRLNAARGTDGFGLSFIYEDNSTHIFKKADPSTFVSFHMGYQKEIDDAIDDYPLAVLGHTRAATVGNVSDRNCHPFEKGNIIGAHNGGISNWWQIARRLQVDDDTEVDSEVIFSLLAQSSTWKEALEQLEGSFALTWWDRHSPKKLNFTRHINPLEIFQVGEVKMLAWSSDDDHLSEAFDGVKGQYFSFEENKRYQLHLDKLPANKEGQVLFTVEGFTPPTRYSWTGMISQRDRSDSGQVKQISSSSKYKQYGKQLTLPNRRHRNHRCHMCKGSTKNTGLPLRIMGEVICGHCAKEWMHEQPKVSDCITC